MKTKLNLLAAVFLVTAGSAGAAVRYVDANSANAAPPYTNWATAARVIQDAVDAADAGDEIVVTNGTYATGGRAVVGTMTNRVAVDRPLTLRSVNGPQVTVIQGGSSSAGSLIRCVYLATGATLSGFTLTNGLADSGGGVWGESSTAVVSNCVVVGNTAFFSGGGAAYATLNNCPVAGNRALAAYGGGAVYAMLNNCTVTGNSAVVGGGAAYSGLQNCLVTGNSASNHGGGGFAGGFVNCTVINNSAVTGAGGASECNVANSILYYNNGPSNVNYVSCFMGYSCTTPDPGASFGLGHNITSAPRFVNQADGNLRLQASSPCINAGINGYPNASAPGPTDLDGNPRIVHGTVDIGAYEFQGPGSVISYAWLQQYGLPTDGSADSTDPDGDGLNNWQEWRCGTDPRNAASVLRLLSASPAGSTVTVTWQSVSGMSYFLERSTNLAVSPPFTLLATNLPGRAGTTSFTDTNAAAAPRLFYRVGVL